MTRRELIHADISGAIIGCFFPVYNELGFGYLAPIYARAMEILLREAGRQVEREYPIPVHFRGQQIGFHRCDMLVEKKVIVELKATELLAPFVERQVRNYLTGSGLSLGMVLHFGPKPKFIPVLSHQIQRPGILHPENLGDPVNPEIRRT